MALAPSHVENLKASGLSHEMIQLMGVSSLLPAEISRLAPGGFPGVESVLEFPYPNVDTFSRYKFFPPFHGKNGTLKYFQKTGTGSHLYILAPVKEILSDPTFPLQFHEGEKKTALAVQLEKRAIGVGGVWSWVDGGTSGGIGELDAIALVDRPVELVFDSDVWVRPDLQRALFAFGKDLEGRGTKVSIVIIPGINSGKIGFDDFILAKGIDEFEKLKRITLKHPTMSQHLDWWKNWKAKKEEGNEATSNSNSNLVLSEPEPWPEPVDADQLLKDICKVTKRHVVASDACYVTSALWALFAHAIDAFDISPYLTLSSPAMRCAKSLLLSIISRLVSKPLTTSNITPAALYRVIEKYKPSLLVDEGDTFINLSPELRGVLNAGHYRNSAIVIRTVGDEHEPKTFSVWCPKAIALIGNLPATLMDRSIVIPMRRKRKDEHVARFFPSRENPELRDLCAKAARWTKDNFDALRARDPEMPDDLDDRCQDNWRPLLAIADLAGGDWPTWAKAAALALNGVRAEEPGTGVELLTDIKNIIDGIDKIGSEDLVRELNDLKARPWPDWNKQKGITQRQVASILKGFAIRPKKIRCGDKTLQGYEALYFKNAFECYLTDKVPDTASNEGFDLEQAEQVNEFKDFLTIFDLEQGPSVPDGKNGISAGKDENVPDVPDENTKNPWEAEI